VGEGSEDNALARRMRGNGEPVPVIAEAVGVSRATLYCYLAKDDGRRAAFRYNSWGPTLGVRP
jgi:Helix-turn-helix domain of resolvase